MAGIIASPPAHGVDDYADAALKIMVTPSEQ
jgi:hypothetical protein